MKVYNFSFRPSPYEVFLHKGIYKFEAWGAAGGYWNCSVGDERRGRGAYVNGVIHLKKGTTFFVYVGENGEKNFESFNGNHASNASLAGGGATDFRLQNGEWYDISSLKSRIMVAAGGGGNDCVAGGDGGTFEGLPPEPYENEQNHLENPTGGTQVGGGYAGRFSDQYEYAGNGTFGVGGIGDHSNLVNGKIDGGGGGGGGYYGGGGISGLGGGGGGSSFVSGHYGCNAIIGDTDEIIHSNQSFQYSGLYFESSQMIAGDSIMPDPLSDSYETKNMTGNLRSGYARITVLSICYTVKYNQKLSSIQYLLIIALLS